MALLADMGTGKTKIAIDIAAYKFEQGLHDTMLVVAPNAVHPQWISEQFPKHCPVPWTGASYFSSMKSAERKIFDEFMLFAHKKPQLRVLTCGYSIFITKKGVDVVKQFFAKSQKPPIIILDEASHIKNPGIATTKTIKALAYAYPYAFKAVLTGTPAAKSPVDMWSLFDFLKPRYMGCSYTAFKLEYSIQVRKELRVKNKLVTFKTLIDVRTYSQIIKSVDKIIDLQGELKNEDIRQICDKHGIALADFYLLLSTKQFQRFKNLDKLQKIIAPVTFQIAKKDCMDLPEKIYHKIMFEPNKEQAKLIKDLKKYALAAYGDKVLPIEVKATLGMRILQICGGFLPHIDPKRPEKYICSKIDGPNHKLDYIMADIPEIGDAQFLVLACFVEELKLIYETLCKEYDVGILMGDTPQAIRQQYIDEFKAGELNGLVINPAVGGYGLNLQKARVQYWYSRSYRTEARLQTEDRSYRMGIKDSPIYKDLVYNVCFEKEVLNVLKEGRDINTFFMTNNLDQLLGGD